MKQTIYKLSITCLLLSCYQQLGATTPADDCKKLFNTGFSQQAISPCTQAAKSNNREAQTTLGEIYDEKGDSAKTAFWWEQAASANHQPARNLLALKYYYGGTVFGAEKGWDQDYPKAFEIWRKDAKNNIATSQFMIGVMYHKGQGIEQNLSESWYWLKRSLDNGYKLATDVLIEISREITPQQKHLGENKLTDYKKKNPKKQTDSLPLTSL